VECQRRDYRGEHKAECAELAHPPFAREFNPDQRPDVPWPVDPVYGIARSDGLGLWVTGSHSVDLRCAPMHLLHSPR
jgi:hypothetical protein